jgi:hypothetical protein
MAGRKLSDLTTTESLSNDDLVYVVDVSAAAGSKSKGITKANLAAQMSTSVASTEPVENEYADITALLADQGNQTTSFLQYVVDASDDPNIVSGEAYYEKLATSTTTLADDYRLLSDTEVTVVKDSNSYRVFRIEAIQDEGTPLTSVSGGKVSFEYSGANVTAILFNKRYTDAIAEFYGKDVSIRFHNRAANKYETEAVASTAWTTVNTDYYRAEVTGTNIQIADLSVNNRCEFFIVEAATGGGSTATSKTGTSIVFTENALYNEATYLTSGNLTLSLTGAVKDTYCAVYCNGYVPTISGEDVFISSGALSANKLNILSFYYDGTKIYLNIGNVDNLTAPTLTLTPGDEEMQIDWSAITNADNYVIERADDSGFTTNLTEIYNGALLTYTNTGLTNGTTYYFRGKAEGAGYIESTWGATVSDAPEAGTDFTIGLVASYQFSGTSGLDYTTNHNASSSTYTNATGKVGNCASFNGTTENLVINSSGDFTFSDGVNDVAFSICFWVNPDAATGVKYLMDRSNGGNSDWLIFRQTSDITMYIASGGSNTNRYNAVIGYTASTWNHMVITYDGSETLAGLKTYLNGVASGSQTQTGTYVRAQTSSANNIYIGGSDSGTNRFDGDFDELKIYKNRVLTPTEILEMYTLENAGTSVLP